MTRVQRWGTAALCLVMAVSSVIPAVLRAAGPAGGAAAAVQNKGRSPEKIMADLTAAQEEATKVMPSLTMLADPDFRKADGQKVLPSLKKMIGLMKELEDAAASNPDIKEIIGNVRSSRYIFMAIAGALGDKDTMTALENTAKGKDAEAVTAKSALALDKWLLAGKDAAAQEKVLDEFAEVAKENPTNDDVAAMLGAMASLGPANNEVTKKVIDVMRTNLKGDKVKQSLADLDAQQEQLALIGKPFAFEGRTSTGGKFATGDYKGKVVMVDFWATWCGPCIGELPNVKKAYADYHGKGFEIVGVSCDVEDGVLNAFTQKEGMTWVQLREDSQSEADRWHPLAKKFHVDGIPAMFLIDRKGVLRYVDAREDLSKKIAELVAEPDTAATKPAAK